MIWLELNAKIKPFDNVDVRRAVNLAIPRDEIIRTIYYGYADPQTAPMPYIYPMADQSFFTYEYDLAKAKELLAKAGVGEGLRARRCPTMPAIRPRSRSRSSSRPRCGRSASSSRSRSCPAGVFYENVTKRAKPMIFYLDFAVDAGPGLLDLSLLQLRRAT